MEGEENRLDARPRRIRLPLPPPPAGGECSGALQPALPVTLTLTSGVSPRGQKGNSGSILARVRGGPFLHAGAFGGEVIFWEKPFPDCFLNWILLPTHSPKKKKKSAPFCRRRKPLRLSKKEEAITFWKHHKTSLQFSKGSRICEILALYLNRECV